MTTEQLSALRDAITPALASLGFVLGLPAHHAPSAQALPEAPGAPGSPEVSGATSLSDAPRAPSLPQGWHAWSSAWATVLVVPIDNSPIEAKSMEVELWARQVLGLPLRNRPRRDWYVLLAADRPVKVGDRLAVESIDRVLRRHVVEWKDDAWDLGRVAFLPLGFAGHSGAADEPSALPELAVEILRLYREGGENLSETKTRIDEQAKMEAADAH